MLLLITFCFIKFKCSSYLNFVNMSTSYSNKKTDILSTISLFNLTHPLNIYKYTFNNSKLLIFIESIIYLKVFKAN